MAIITRRNEREKKKNFHFLIKQGLDWKSAVQHNTAVSSLVGLVGRATKGTDGGQKGERYAVLVQCAGVCLPAPNDKTQTASARTRAWRSLE